MMTPRNRRLWQRLSPIACFGDSADESPTEHNEVDESDGSNEPSVIPVPHTSSYQNTNISVVASVQDGDTIIESIECEAPPSVLESLQLSDIAMDSPSTESTDITDHVPKNIYIGTDESRANATLPANTSSLPDSSKDSTELSSSHGPVTDRCYGVLVVHYNGDLPPDIETISILLIHQQRPPPLRALPPYWGFPKGHPEPEDRDPWATALRELNEETGLNPLIIKPITHLTLSPYVIQSEPLHEPLKIISRYPNHNGGIKEVTFFLSRVADYAHLTAQAEEVLECRWVTLPVAQKLIQEKPVRKVLNELIRLFSPEPAEDELPDSE